MTCDRKFLAFLTHILLRRDPCFIFPLIFGHFVSLRLNRLVRMQLRLKAVPSETLKYFLKENEQSRNYVDPYSYALASPDLIKSSTASWHHVCSTLSSRKYKILILPSSDINRDELLLSETVLFNIENALGTVGTSSDKYFILPSSDVSLKIAKEAAVSLVSNPFDCTNELIDMLLHNYFSEARYLRPNDIFNVRIDEYAHDYAYSTLNPNCKDLFFRVKSVKVCDEDGNGNNGCHILRDETALMQETNVHSYLPRKDTRLVPGEYDSLAINQIEDLLLTTCPPSLKESSRLLEACIAPFIQDDILVDMRPVFLVKGSPGSGRSKLIQIAAERMGLNLYSIDFSEVQSLTAAQTEAKLRIVLHNAENCTPCILILSNIQIFGKDGEGREDERTISSFAIELKNLYKKRLEYPIIVIATADDSDISPSLQRAFIETIEIKYLDQTQRVELMEWMLRTRGLSHEANLKQVARLCSDFVLADLEALVLHAAKNRYKISECNTGPSAMTLMQDDFVKACEYMQSLYSDRIGAPRVPKVYWEDIGGLADLKHEILRRIELPLLTSGTVGLGRSGLLLYGPPGTGKTLLAKAVATECQLHFLSVKGPELLNMYVGQSEKNVRQVFERARASAPCVIFFDELDSLAPNRGRSGDSGGVMDRVVSQLLAEMDGLESSGSVFIIGATNRPDLIDPALLRPGRFDKLLYVGIYSDQNSQLSVLKALTRKFKMQEDGRELEEIVKKLPDNLTGADLYAVCSNAWLLAVRRTLTTFGDIREEKTEENFNETSLFKNGIVVALEDFVQAARDVVPSVSKDELQRYEILRSQLSSPQVKVP